MGMKQVLNANSSAAAVHRPRQYLCHRHCAPRRRYRRPRPRSLSQRLQRMVFVLQRVLRSPGMANTAVLVNEFGEVGLDHHLLRRIDERTVLLGGGCIGDAPSESTAASTLDWPFGVEPSAAALVGWMRTHGCAAGGGGKNAVATADV